ncbi:DUF4440 domain-containing protein [Rheinheimera marina]|uniref:DUF4440 domain-containing protein n=1 Tax=Rheinheimera marina TaxID=1774958 RepID=A0ABV9JGQ0_9GAMM
MSSLNPDKVKLQLVELEQQLFQPETRACPERLAALIADDFEEINAAGQRYGKEPVLQRLPGEQAPKIQAGNYQLRLLGPDHAQLLYLAIVTRAGAEPAYSQRCSIWRRQQQHWQMIYHQGTNCAAFDAAFLQG